MTELVLLDACVLVPYNLSSLLLALAEEELFEPRWSDRIFEEVERTLIAKMDRPPDKVTKRLGAMREAFPEAFVYGFEWMEPSLSCDPKDRHVLAAAVASNATTIVTTNLKDFPEGACAPHDVVVVHPELFLMDLLALDAGACAAAVMRDADRKIRPPTTPQQLLAGVTDLAPTFANTIHQVILDGPQPTSDIPAHVSVPDEHSPVHAWGQHHNPEDPLHVAFAWWAALLDRDSGRAMLEALTHAPVAWGDYEWAAGALSNKSIASKVYFAVDDPRKVAFVRFVPAVAQTSQAFASLSMRGPVFLTLCRHPDGGWRVWGLGAAMVPARAVLS